MAQSIKSLRKSVRNLQRKVKKEERRQEIVVGLELNILELSEKYSSLRENGTPGKLYWEAKELLINKKAENS